MPRVQIVFAFEVRAASTLSVFYLFTSFAIFFSSSFLFCDTLPRLVIHTELNLVDSSS